MLKVCVFAILKSATKTEKNIKLIIFKKLPMQILQYILIKIFALNLFLTRCFYLKLEKNLRISKKSLLRKTENINFKLCSIKHENFCNQKLIDNSFSVDSLRSIEWISLAEWFAMWSEHNWKFFAGNSRSRKILSEKTISEI